MRERRKAIVNLRSRSAYLRDRFPASRFPPPASRDPLPALPHPALSSSTGHPNPPCDYLLFQLFDARACTVGNESAVAVVVDVADAAFLESERVDAALEGAVLDPADDVERRGVDALHHRNENVARGFIVLIGVDTDCELVGRARGLEHALPGRARSMEDYFDALIVLAQRQLLSFAGILECIRRYACVLRDDLTIGADLLY